jgi:transketolase
VPSLDLFAQQSQDYRAAMIGAAPVKIAVEAGIRQGWDAVIDSDGIFVGMESFGASAPYEQLYAHFGITSEAIVAAAETRIHGEASHH